MALTVKKSIDVAAAPDKAWAAIGDFCGIAAWHPAVAKCALERKGGKTYRRLSLKGGGEILEQQSAWDGAGRSYGYTIVESPLPVVRYESTLAVTAKGSGAAPDRQAVTDVRSYFAVCVASLMAM